MKLSDYTWLYHRRFRVYIKKINVKLFCETYVTFLNIVYQDRGKEYAELIHPFGFSQSYKSNNFSLLTSSYVATLFEVPQWSEAAVLITWDLVAAYKCFVE